MSTPPPELTDATEARATGGNAAERPPRSWKRRVLRATLATVAVLGCACAVFLSVRNNSNLASVDWIPTPISEWADRHGRLRNLPAYFTLACPFLGIANSTLQRVGVAAALGVFGTVLEIGERFVPSRWFDWNDIGWTWAGVAAAWAAFESLRFLVTRVRPFLTCRLLS